MIIDTSALLAVLKAEPERGTFLELITGARVARMSAATYVEASIVVDALGDPVKTRRFDELLTTLAVQVVDVSPDQARTARAAYRDFGNGTGHPAGLNFGDVFAYALATEAGEPLLFKGDDFSHTDVPPAVRASG